MSIQETEKGAARAENEQADLTALGNMAFAELVAETSARWQAYNNIALDIRVAHRDGNEAEVARLTKQQNSLSARWFRAYSLAKQKARAAVTETLGIDPDVLKGLLS